MSRLRKIRKLLRILKINAKVCYGDEFCVIWSENRPKITIVSEKFEPSMLEMEFHKLLEKKYNISDVDFNLMATLHEVGHVFLNHCPDNEYIDAVHYIDSRLYKGDITITQAQEEYSNLRFEREANEWSINFYKSNRTLLDKI